MRIIMAVFVLMFGADLMAQSPVTFTWTPPTEQISGVELRLTSSEGLAPITFQCEPASLGKCTVPVVQAGSWSAVAVPYNTGVPIELKAFGPVSAPVVFKLPASPTLPISDFKLDSIEVNIKLNVVR